MRTIFCRLGSKLRLRKKILGLFPKNYQDMLYVEPFVGSGAVFFKKEKAKKEILNDIDSNLIKHYKLIKQATLQEIRKYKKPKSLEELNAFVKETGGTPADKLARFIVKTCNSFSYSGKGKIYKDFNPFTKLIKIKEYQERLKGVQLLNKDYKEVLRKYDTNNTLFYLDPPYENSQEYQDNDINYQEMSTLLKSLKGKFILSINDSPFTRRIFKGFTIKSILVQAQSNGKGLGTTPRKELLILNF